MLFDGQTIKVEELGEGIVELRFERGAEAVNKLDAPAFDEMRRAIGAIAAAPGLKGVLITSAKDAFIVGADIFEFSRVFSRETAEIAKFVADNSRIITALDDLPVPTIAAINGLALGGGLEVVLAADYRVMSAAAKIGFPEIHLGVFPGYGGSVRLPRLIGLAESAQWIISGAQQSPETALDQGAVDAVVAPQELRGAAIDLLKKAIADPDDWRERRRESKEGLGLSEHEIRDLLVGAEVTAAKALPHFPAAHDAIALLEAAANLDRDDALALEAARFAKTAKTQAAASLVTLFVNEQALKKIARRYAKTAAPVSRAAVVGAGVMGVGIAYQSALRGVPIILKDISDEALKLGMSEAKTLLDKQVEQGRLKRDAADAAAAAITPSLTFEGFAAVDVVVEAIVENLAVKTAVLREIEGAIGEKAILASNTSSLRIGDLAQGLRRPENVIGMHFFNPVPRMALVEVVRGPKTSEAAVATIVAYAAAMGKTPIVVGDCPGFVVNRVLTPYLIAFLRLVHDGVDFKSIDAAMEAFGWPMGPAYLIDVIGLDIAHHVIEIVSAGYSGRMKPPSNSAIGILLANRCLGRKNGRGFYRYANDPSGQPRKEIDPAVEALLASGQPHGKTSISEVEIVERMMLPLIFEAARCLEDGVVASPGEADMCLLLGLGLPRYLGGALKYADYLGLKNVVDRASKWDGVSEIYRPSEKFLTMAVSGEAFYPA
jgi:3-hydroxyacyl-CoA dehydrogenase/enoyl-CoA hydratase/3-hydroxybutyryl-CoA epimerase/enoyl-CoA isomerase